MRKKIIKFLNLLIELFTIIVVISLLILVVERIIYKEDIPNLFGFKFLQVLSGSMSGTFEAGDLILVKEVKNENKLKVGDVVTYRVGEAIITHRIIDITKEKGILEYTTKGDANNTQDLEKTTFNKIEGKYIFKIRILGKFLKIMNTPLGMTIIVMGPIIIILCLITQDNKRKLKETIRKEKRLSYELNRERKKYNEKNA